MTRTDPHRPSTIVPGDYEFVAIEAMKIRDLGDCEAIKYERERLRSHMEQTGGTYAAHAHGGNCHVCGNANAIYTALFYHPKTNSYVRMGQDCAAKCDMGHAADFRRITDAAKAAEFARAGKLKAQGVLSNLGLEAAWTIYTTTRESLPYEEATIIDIVNKLIRYGSISDAQAGLVRKLIEQIPQRAEREEQRIAERESAKPAPTGKLKVEVEVISVKGHENDYGTRWVMTVKSLADGWLAWGTAPAGVNKGDRLTLSATF